MMEILSVAVGGALGAVCRYLLGNFISRMSGSALPWGTFAINIIGCFCMGLLMTLIVERGLLPAAWRLFPQPAFGTCGCGNRRAGRKMDMRLTL